MTKQTILDRVLEHDMLRVNIESRLGKILELMDKHLSTEIYLYMMDTAHGISWVVCDGFLRVRLEKYDYDYGAMEEWIEVDFDWLDMPDDELEKLLKDKAGLEEIREHKRAVDQLKRDAEYYGYTLVEVWE